MKVNGIFDKLFVFQGFDHRFQHSLDIPDRLSYFLKALFSHITQVRLIIFYYVGFDALDLGFA
ncbi:MAG: hypothetical protein JRJ20_01310 [Deltaproteobacteria bacterium]|nr:hypothetical protein [Deltaproteobacteria bacterium]